MVSLGGRAMKDCKGIGRIIGHCWIFPHFVKSRPITADDYVCIRCGKRKSDTKEFKDWAKQWSDFVTEDLEDE